MSDLRVTPASDPDRPKFSVVPGAFNTWLGYVLNAQHPLVMSLVMWYVLGLCFQKYLSTSTLIAMALWVVFAFVDHHKGILPYKPRSKWSAKQIDLWDRMKAR